MTQAAIKRFTLAEYHRLIELGFLTTVSPIKILKEILVIASDRLHYGMKRLHSLVFLTYRSI
jgi:hypothetical protein